MNRYVGNLPPMPGVFPDYPAPVIRNTDIGREMTTMRWGMPPPPRAGNFPVTKSGSRRGGGVAAPLPRPRGRASRYRAPHPWSGSRAWSDRRGDQRRMGENDIEYGQVADRADGCRADVPKDSGHIYSDAVLVPSTSVLVHLAAH